MQWFHASCPLDLCSEHGCSTAKKYTYILTFFKMQLNNFTVQHTNTYMHTDTTCIQHVNMGLAQARPSYTLASGLIDRIEQR